MVAVDRRAARPRRPASGDRGRRRQADDVLRLGLPRTWRSATSPRVSTSRIPTIRSRSGTTSRRPIAMNRPCRAPAATRSTAAPPTPTASSCYGTLDGFVIALDAADWQGSLGRQARLAREGRDHHVRSAHRREPRHHRLRRRRVRSPRPRHGLRPQRRQESVGVPFDRLRQGRLPDGRHQQGQPALRHGRHGSRHQDAPRRGLQDRRRRGLGLVQLRSRAEDGLLLDRQPRSVEPVLSLHEEDARRVQHGRVRQQVVDDHFRPQGRHRRSRLGLPDDALRPVGL